MATDDEPQAPAIRDLISHSRNAKRNVADRLNNSHDQYEDALGWGQYIDSSLPRLPIHTGIFGTAAVLEVLAMTDAPEYHASIRAGLLALPLVTVEPDESDASYGKAMATRQHYVNKGDLKITHKVAALLDAATSVGGAPNSDLSETLNAASAAAMLLDLRLTKSGWPDHRSSTSSSKHATAVALLSLSRVKPDDRIKAALRETANKFSDNDFDALAVSTTAILLMAIQNFHGSRHCDEELIGWQNIERAAEAALLEWISSSSPAGVKRTLEATEYASPASAGAPQAPSDGRWSFLIYLPHVMVAQAILRCRRLRSKAVARRFVLVVLNIVVTSLLAKQQFVTGGRLQVSTVEHMWIARLLDTFETEAEHIYGRNVVAVVSDRLRLSGAGETVGLVLPVLFAVGLFVAAQLVGDPYWRTGLQLAAGALIGSLFRVYNKALRRWL